MKLNLYLHLVAVSKLTMEAVQNLSGTFDNRGDTSHVYRPPGTKCLLYKADSNLCMRVSTTADFYEVNKQVSRSFNF